MTGHPPPDDVPETDRIEQQTPLQPDPEEENSGLADRKWEADEADTVGTDADAAGLDHLDPSGDGGLDRLRDPPDGRGQAGRERLRGHAPLPFGIPADPARSAAE